MKRVILSGLIVFALLLIAVSSAAAMPQGKEYTNSVGMKFVRIEPGQYQMGQLETLQPELLPLISGGDRGGRFDFLARGDFDEKIIHTVKITKPFYVGMFEVTNFQYELFDQQHKTMRGKNAGLSSENDEAVINVNWYNAKAFCQWLSDKEGLPYRLPTEAEWEYTCRSETKTNYHTGDILPQEFLKNPDRIGEAKYCPLFVGKTTPNAWGIYDLHGNVEEWCEDWYGTYKPGTQTDPVGYANGDFRVTRGGSHSTFVYYLRSANRLAALPEDRHWLIGFRVVIGEMPKTKPLPVPNIPLNQRGVVQRDKEKVLNGPDPKKPYFKQPRRFVKIPSYQRGPLFAGHNHNPAIAECPNGDLLAIWYTCVSEKDRELAQAASRLRYGQDEWEEASTFWDVPDRNDHAPTLWFDGNDTLYHLSGMSMGPAYASLSMIMRKSKDSGATWSRARVILPEYDNTHQASEPMIRLNDGGIAIAVDNGPLLWITRDKGLTWFNSISDVPRNHPGVVQLDNGRLFMMAREAEIDGRMPIAASDDLGKTWVRWASEFPGIGGGQRLVLLKLKEGALFLASFAGLGIDITDSSGTQRKVRGLFGALSYDGGKTWPVKKLISDNGPGTVGECTDGGLFIMSSRSAEFRGYLSGCQGIDGVIHVVSSRTHYAFNQNWLETPAPELMYPPFRVQALTETFDGPEKLYNDGWVDYHDYTGGFNGKGQYIINSTSHFNGINHIVGEGSFEMNFSFKNIRFNDAGPTSSPGITIWIMDALSQKHAFNIRHDSVDLNGGIDVKYDKPPTEAKLRIIYSEKTLQWHIYYGLNGDEAVKELDITKKGFTSPAPLGESTAMYILMSCGSVEADNYQIKPLDE